MTEPTDNDLDVLLAEHWPAFATSGARPLQGMRAAMRAAIAKWGKPPEVAREQVGCGNCGGTGWMVRDPDIGTDQECFVCGGSGGYSESAAPQPSQAQAGAVPPPWMEPGAFFGGRPPLAMDIDSEDFYGITEAIHHALEMLEEHDDANTDASPLDPKRSRRLCQALMAAWMLEYPREAAAHGIKGGQHGTDI